MGAYAENRTCDPQMLISMDGAKNATGSDIAELLVKGRRRIARFSAKTAAPFVAAINGSSRVRMYLDI